MRVHLDAGRHPYQDLGPRPTGCGLFAQASETDDLVEGVDDDPTHAQLEGPGQFGLGLVVAVQHQAFRRDPRRQGHVQLPPVATSRQRPSSWTRAAMARHKNALVA